MMTLVLHSTASTAASLLPFDFSWTAVDVKARLAAGADANAKDEDGVPVLVWAGAVNNSEIVQTLVAAGADTRSKGPGGITALMVAAEKGNQQNIQVLIEAGADVTAKDDEGRTVLMYAARQGDGQVIRTLIGAGVDVNAKDVRGRTALMYAASNPSSSEVIGTLIAKTTDIDTRDIYGQTALMFATGNGHHSPEVTRKMIRAGADVNARADNGITPLIRAASGSGYQVYQILVDAGANAGVVSEAGKTISDYIQSNPFFWLPWLPAPLY